jgi:DNA adenine methylase
MKDTYSKKKLKTFIKWNGNKSHYTKIILSHFPSELNTYIEPFLGSGAVFLEMTPKKYLINDINCNLIRLWNLIKTKPNTVLNELEQFRLYFLNLENEQKKEFCRNTCFGFRKIKKWNQKNILQWWFMILSSYMGSIIHNNKYYFNGLDMNILKFNRPTAFSENFKENLSKVSSFLNESNGEIKCLHFTKILEKAKEGDFVFLDPPYLRTKKYNNLDYNIDLTEPTIEEIYKQCQMLDKKKVKWLMTQIDSPLIRKLFSEYKIIRLSRFCHRTLKRKRDIIIMNYNN